MASSSGIKATKAYVLIEGKLVKWNPILQWFSKFNWKMAVSAQKATMAFQKMASNIMKALGKMGLFAFKTAAFMGNALIKVMRMSGLSGLSNSFSKLGVQLNKLPGIISRVQSSLHSMAQNAALAFSAIAAPSAYAVKTYADFDDVMRKVEARSVGTAAEMKALRDQAELLGATTSYTAQDVGELQAKLAQKGFDRKEIKDATEGILNLARAAGEMGVEDTTIAADAVATIIRSFKMEASDAGRVADILTEAVNGSNLSLEGLKDSFSYIGPLAHQTGMSLEETMAALGGLGNVSIEASMAGTAVRRMLLIISDAKERASFDELLMSLTGMRVEMKNAAGDLRPLPDILFDIDKATKNLGNAEKLDFMNQVFGVYGVSSASALSEMGPEYDKLLKRLKNSTGAAAKTAKTMDAGLGGAFREIASAIESVVIAIGKALEPTLLVLTASLQTVILNVSEWIGKNPLLVNQILVGTAALGAFAAALFVAGTGAALLASIVSVVIGLGSTLFTVLSILSSPVIILGAGVVMLANHFGLLNGVFATTSSGLNTLLADFQSGALSIQNSVKAIAIAIKGGDIKTASEIMFQTLRLVWVTGWTWIEGTWDKFSTNFLGSIGDWMNSVEIIFVKLWDNLKISVALGGALLYVAIMDILDKISMAFYEMQLYAENAVLAAGTGGLSSDFDDATGLTEAKRAAFKEQIRKDREGLTTHVNDGLVWMQVERDKRAAPYVERAEEDKRIRNEGLKQRQDEREGAILNEKRLLDAKTRGVIDQAEVRGWLEAAGGYFNQGMEWYNSMRPKDAAAMAAAVTPAAMSVASRPLSALMGVEKGTSAAEKLAYESAGGTTEDPIVKEQKKGNALLEQVAANTANIIPMGDAANA